MIKIFSFLLSILLVGVCHGQTPTSSDMEAVGINPESLPANKNVQFADKNRNNPINVTEAVPINPVKKRDKDEFVIAPTPF